MAWTETDIPDQTGRVAVITGANSGIGWEAARALAEHGATVVLACRSAERGQDAVRRIQALKPDAQVSLLPLDLADLASVHAFAADLSFERIDLLLNNAGVMAIPRRETTDGFEMQLGVNHLGHFALTGLLIDRLAPNGRIVTVSSNAHRMGRIDTDNLMHEHNYQRWTVYGGSKLANLLFHSELTRRLAAAGRPTLSVACHPGYTDTNLVYRGPEYDGRPWQVPIFWLGGKLFAQGPKPGAAPTLYAATMPDVSSGDYIGPRGPMEMWGAPRHVQMHRRAHDPDNAKRLWQASAELTGVDYL